MIRLLELKCRGCGREWQDTTASLRRRGPSCPYCGQRHQEPNLVRRAADLIFRPGHRTADAQSGGARAETPLSNQDGGS